MRPRLPFRSVAPGAIALACALALASAGDAASAAPFDILDTEQDSVDLDAPTAVVPSPDGKHVYACGSFSNTLTAYAVDGATGVLSFVGVSIDDDETINGLTGCADLAITPDGKHVYAAGRFESALGIFSRDAASGALTFVDAIFDGDLAENALLGASALALSPDAKHLYVTAISGDTLAVFSRDAGTGQLTLLDVVTETIGGPPNLLSAPNAVVVSPDGALVYVTTEGQVSPTAYADALLTFERDAVTGLLTQIDTERNGVEGIVGLALPNAIAATRDRKDVYVTAGESNAIGFFGRVPEDDSTQWFGLVTDASPGVNGLNGAVSIAITRDGRYVLVTGYNDAALAVFTRDAETGLLAFDRVVVDDDSAARKLLGATDVAIDPLGRFFYVVAFTDDALTVFAPEPGATALGASACAALALCARRSRRATGLASADHRGNACNAGR